MRPAEEGVRPSLAAPSVSIRLGQSIAVDFHHCRRARLADLEKVRGAMLSSARESGATVIDAHFHEFSPQGISGVVVIAESHFAIHTWPEYEFAAVDLFTCGSSIDFDRAIEVLEAGFQASVVSVSHRMERGTMGASRAELQSVDPNTASASSWHEKFTRENAGNIFALVDIEGCRGEPHELAGGARSFLVSARELLDVEQSAEIMVDSKGNGETAFSLAGAHSAIVGRVVHATGRAYLSIMSGTFFEPAVLARSSIRHFAGTQYGLHVGINP